MMFIKVDSNGDPEGFPISYENVQYLTNTAAGAAITPEALAEFNLVELKHYHAPAGGPGVDIDAYDIVRKDIFKNEDGDIEQRWQITEISLKEKIRRWVAPQRLSYLLRSDWTQVADAPLTPEEKAAWAEYRSKLRSITEDIDFNTVHSRIEFDWPTMPGALNTADTKWADTPEDPPQP